MYLKLFEDFNQIHKICRKYGIKNYTMNSDGSIDVDGCVDLSFEELTKIPLQFRNVSGYFYCTNNSLTTLEGSPSSVGSFFNCRNNNIITFEGFETMIGGDFYCRNNPIFEIWKLFNDVTKIELFNYYDITRGYSTEPGILSSNHVSFMPTLVLDRLNSFLEDIGKGTVKSVPGWKCI